MKIVRAAPSGNRSGELYQFVEFKFTAAELQAIPKQHSTYMVATCFAINEILVFLRLTLHTINSLAIARGDDRMASIAFMQDQILLRTLSGKAVEYLKVIRDHRKICERAGDVTIKAFFDKYGGEIDEIWDSTQSKFAVELRNNLISHIGLDRIRKSIAALPHDRREMNIYLHNKDGNTVYPIGEDVAHIAAFDTTEQVDEWSDWVLKTCKTIQGLHHQYMIWIIETFFPSKMGQEIRIEIDDRLLGPLTQNIPILWDFPFDKNA
ncbi:hypothetical protein [Devosia sp.]|uniref:hypothetical protein n=1 Tax=Devosia sp. TaxID=1871048 RepID=UPI001B133DC3|nr:hypothetical protein [Devosia sp.]MBO9589471.1 hypothetical protein [Devosia sp.]